MTSSLQLERQPYFETQSVGWNRQDVIDETDRAGRRIAELCPPAPLTYAPSLFNKIGATVYFKREDLTKTRSFKERGAANAMLQLPTEELQRGVFAASAGNHAQGVAKTADFLGVQATIFMPETTPLVKVNAVRNYGASAVLIGENYSDACAACLEEISRVDDPPVFIHPFDNIDVITGQGTIASEIIIEQPDVTHIFVPVGGGGLIAGIARYIKAVRPDICVIGVEPEDSNAMQHAFKIGKPTDLPNKPSGFADGVAVSKVGDLTYKLARENVDDIITTTEDEICLAMADFHAETKSIIEPAGALAIAGIKAFASQDKSARNFYVAVCSGANVSPEKFAYAMDRANVLSYPRRNPVGQLTLSATFA